MNGSYKNDIYKVTGAWEQVPEAKIKLLEAGARLMSRKGFHATSLNDICDEANVKKGSFYYYFEDKVAFAKYSLLHFLDSVARHFEDAPFSRLEDPLERVLGRLEFAASFFSEESHVSMGCFLSSIAQETCLTHPELRMVCNESFIRSTRPFERDVLEAKLLYAPEKPIDHQNLAIFYMALQQGSLLVGKSMGSGDVVKNSLQEFQRYVSWIFQASER